MAIKIPTAKEMAKTTSIEAVKEISTLAARQVRLEDDIAALDEQRNAKHKQLYLLSTVDIPSAMKTAGVQEIKLDDGTWVVVKNFITGSIKVDDREKAHSWLRKNGFGSLIKNIVDCAFGMGEDKKAITVMKFLKGKKIPFTQKETVNSNTLQAFIRERLAAGKALPSSIGYTEVPTSKITRSKENQNG